jgi:hypothetical protein
MKKRLNLRSILATLMLTMLVVTAFATPDEKPSKPGSVYSDPFAGGKPSSGRVTGDPFSKPNYPPNHP